MEKVEKSAKLDKMVLDGLKNARKSDNDELSQLAHQAVDIIIANSKVKELEISATRPDLLFDDGNGMFC
jgi:hypothetical protein